MKPLTKMEQAYLETLRNAAGETVPRGKFALLHGMDARSNVVDVHIKNLRTKLADNERIVCTRGVGYRLETATQ